MTASAAFDSISGSGDDFQQVVALCESLRDYCLIGGLAINCYVEPVYTMDAAFALAAAHLDAVKQRLTALGFRLEDFPYSLNALRVGSQLSIQFTKDERYAGFPARAEIRQTLGVELRVASLPDLVQAKNGRGPIRSAACPSARRTNSISSASRKRIHSFSPRCRSRSGGR